MNIDQPHLQWRARRQLSRRWQASPTRRLEHLHHSRSTRRLPAEVLSCGAVLTLLAACDEETPSGLRNSDRIAVGLLGGIDEQMARSPVPGSALQTTQTTTVQAGSTTAIPIAESRTSGLAPATCPSRPTIAIRDRDRSNQFAVHSHSAFDACGP